MGTQTTVPKNFGTGGSGLTPNKSAGTPDLETLLRDHESQINQMAGAAGAALTDADATIDVSGGYWRVLPAATLSAGRTLTVDDTSSPNAGDQITITRLDATANTYAIANGGPGGGTLYTFAISTIGFVKVQFDGTNWVLREVGTG